MAGREKIQRSELTSTLDQFLAKKRQEKNEKDGRGEGDVPFLNIIEFIDRFKLLPEGLYPVQKFITKLYYNIPLDDVLPEKLGDRIRIIPKFGDTGQIEMTEKQYLRYLFDNGRCNIAEEDMKPRRELILVLGRRSGKSSLSGIYSAYEVYKLLCRGHPQAYYGAPSGSEIRLLCIANDKEQASIVYSEMIGHVEAVDFFKSSLANSTQTYVKFRTEHDREVYGNVGKCIRQGSLILTDGGLVHIETMGDQNGPEWQPLDVNVAQEGKSIHEKTSHFYNGGIQPVKIVETNHGYTLGGTYEHKIKALVDGTIVWRRLDELKEGDYVGINRSTNLWPADYFDTEDLASVSLNEAPAKFLEKVDKFAEWLRLLPAPIQMTVPEVMSVIGITGSMWHIFTFLQAQGNQFKEKITFSEFGRGSTVLWTPTTLKYDRGFSRNEKNVNLPLKLDEWWGRLVGILVGDGSWNVKTGIEIAGGCSEFQQYLKSEFESKFGGCSIVDERSEKFVGPDYPWKLRVHSVPLRKFLVGLGYGDKKPSEKCVPEAILRSPKSVVAGFLSGLFETDGTVDKTGKHISFCTASRRLASEVHLLLLNFGVASSIYAKRNKIYDRDYYTLELSGETSHNIFRNEIRFITNRKNRRVDAVTSYSDRETVPVLSIAQEIGKTIPSGLGLRSKIQKLIGGTANRTGVSYRVLKLCVESADNSGFRSEGVEKLRELVSTNYFWDPIKIISDSHDRVYDLSVPKGHSFVAQGMTNHNSTIVANFKSSIAKGLRGRGIICAIMDEIAFFLNTGSCVRGDTLVLTNKGIIPIDNLGDPYGPRWQDLTVNVAQEGHKCYNMSAKFLNDGVKQTLTIRTKSNYELCGTHNHRVKVLSANGLIEWKQLSDIIVNDYVGINRTTDLWSDSYVDTSQYIEECIISRDRIETSECRTKFINWISSIPGPTVYSINNLAKHLDVHHAHLRSLLLQLRREGHAFNEIVRTKTKGGKINRWIPTKIPFNKLDYYNERGIRLPETLNEDYGQLLGILVGDGTWVKDDGIQITGGCEDFREKLEKFIDKLFDYHNIHFKPKHPRSTIPACAWHVTVHSRPLRRFMYALGYDYSSPNEKHVPWSILRSPKSVVAAFLRGLFETDGGMEKCSGNGKSITFCTVSNRLAREVQLLLLNFGITSSIYEKARDSTRHIAYVIRIFGFESRKIFQDQIGFISDRKKDSLAEGMVHGRDASNVIPHQYARLRKILESIPRSVNHKKGDDRRTVITYICRGSIDANTRGDITYTALGRLIPKAKEFGADENAIRELETLYDTNYFWDKVVSITPGEHKIYDLSVPEGESFVANGMTNHNSSAQSIYKAISPSLAQFSPKDPKDKRIPIGDTEGRIIMISSPDAREGFFYNQYQMAFTKSKASQNTLVIQAPTWEVNPTLSPTYYEIEHAKDPRAFATEHGAEFSDRVRGWIEDWEDLKDNIVPELRPQVRTYSREPHFLGFDLGLTNDGSAVALTRIHQGKIELVYHEVWYPKKRWKDANPHLTDPIVPYAHTLQDRNRLDLSEIANWLLALSKRFGIASGVFDQWTGHVLEQELHKRGLIQIEMRNFFQTHSSQAYQIFKQYMYTKKLALYDYPIPERTQTDSEIAASVKHSPMITELLELQSTSQSKGVVIVEAPQTPGKHDDMSDALARSILMASEFIAAHPGVIEMGEARKTASPRRVIAPSYNQYHRQRNRIHGGQNRLRTPPRPGKIPFKF